MANELAKTSAATNDLVTADYFSEYAGEGMQDLAGVKMAAPRLHIIQPMSPECSKYDKPKGFISIRNVPGRDVEDPLVFESLLFVVGQYKKMWTKWPPKVDGQPRAKVPMWSFEDGFVPADLLHETVWGDGVSKPLDEKPGANETHVFLSCLVGEAVGPYPVVMTFDGPACKPARQFLIRLRGRKMAMPDGSKAPMPLWGSVVAMSTVKNSNDDGVWYDPVFEIQQEPLARELVGHIRKYCVEVDRNLW